MNKVKKVKPVEKVKPVKPVEKVKPAKESKGLIKKIVAAILALAAAYSLF